MIPYDTLEVYISIEYTLFYPFVGIFSSVRGVKGIIKNSCRSHKCRCRMPQVRTEKSTTDGPACIQF